MREELKKKIEERFPFMRRNPFDEEDYRSGTLYDRYSLSIGDGWFDIIWGLCEEVEAAYHKAGVEIDFIPVQVKEKFGTLRFYYDVGGERRAIHAFDFLGFGTIRMQNEETPLYEDISKIVQKWEEKSGYVCETCGAPGTLRKDLRWVLTLCETCYQEQEQRKRRRLSKEEVNE